jgi:hypothetical protein
MEAETHGARRTTHDAPRTTSQARTREEENQV